MLSVRATSTIAISRATPGRRVGRACRPATLKLRKARPCTRFVAAGRLTRKNQAAGAHRVPFSGRIGRRALRPGKYRAAIVAADASGKRSKPALTSFTIVRR
jgi:hypothetical protein